MRAASGSAPLPDFLYGLTDDERSLYPDSHEYAVFELAGSGQNGVTNLFMADSEIGTSFIRDEDRVHTTLTSLRGRETGLSPIWESFVLAAQAFIGDTSNNKAPRIFAFADSAADGSGEGRGTETALEALAEVEGVRVSMVHLDSVEPSSSDYVRTGPMPEYNELACRMDGYYFYETYASGLDSHFRRLAGADEAVWSLQVEVQVVKSSSVLSLSQLDPGWYRMAGTMRVYLAGKNADYDFVLAKDPNAGLYG